jgi:hypothetical protein
LFIDKLVDVKKRLTKFLRCYWAISWPDFLSLGTDALPAVGRQRDYLSGERIKREYRQINRKQA